MIQLYKYLMDSHGLKHVHIKPDNILQSANGILKVYHLDVSTTIEVPQ